MSKVEEEKVEKPTKKLSSNSVGFIALLIGGLLAKFSLVMWLGLAGYILLGLGVVLVLAINE